MDKYRAKSEEFPAKQWFKLGDHDEVKKYVLINPWEKYEDFCDSCEKISSEHGMLVDKDGKCEQRICPGTYVLKTGLGGWLGFPSSEFENRFEKVGPEYG